MTHEQQTRPARLNDFCLNCAQPLKGDYCHHCGQKDLPRRQTMWELIENYVGSTFSFESKFFRTVGALLFLPGLPARDAFAPRRAGRGNHRHGAPHRLSGGNAHEQSPALDGSADRGGREPCGRFDGDPGRTGGLKTVRPAGFHGEIPDRPKVAGQATPERPTLPA